MSSSTQPSRGARREPSRRAQRGPSTALGASLRACVEAARRDGDANRWRPAPSSKAALVWDLAPSDLLALTVCESDVHATALLRSGLDHAAAAARAISSGSAFVPHTLGRTAAENLSRAHHLFDPAADDADRVTRRLNELAYAIDESSIRREAIIKHGHIEDGEAGRSRTDLLAGLQARAQNLGHTIIVGSGRKATKVDGTNGRVSSMRLVESCTAGDAHGIPSFTTRGASAVVHGTELGLLACTREDPVPAPVNAHVNVPVPAPMTESNLAFSLLGVVLTTINAIEAAQQRFEWPDEFKSRRAQREAAAKVIATWSEVLNRDV